jgi:hypothetical protein
MAQSDTDSTSSWVAFGKKIPLSGNHPVHGYRSQHIQLDVGKANSNLWTALLGSWLGYLLPNPTIKQKHVLSDLTQ